MIAGSRNSVSRVENAIANVLLNASGLKSRPSRAPRKKIGRNDVTMISIENSSGLVIVAVAWMIVSIRSAADTLPRRASSAVQFSTITIVASAISPMAMASPASANRLMVWSNARKRQRGEQRAEQQDAHRRHGRPQVLQRDRNDEDDDDQLVADRLEEVGERVPDQRRAVVGRDDLDALGQRRAQRRQPLLAAPR